MEENNKQYNGWLVSNSFIKRALAVYGYALVGGAIFMIPLAFIVPIIFLSLGLTIGVD